MFDAEISTNTYLLWNEGAREAALIDTMDSKVDPDLQRAKALKLDSQERLSRRYLATWSAD